MDDMDFGYDPFVFLAENIMRSSFYLHPVLHEQVQGSGEEKEIEKDEPFEPVSRRTSQGLQVGWNFGLKMVLLRQAAGPGVFADVHRGISYGCSPGRGLIGQNHGVVNGSNHAGFAVWHGLKQ